jgi:transcriptional regulator with XRE-family HTH domain
MVDTKKLIGARIKELRRQAALTQEQLAERVKLDARHLSRLEVGRNFPSLDSLDRIAHALNQPMAEFFHFPGNETPAALRTYLTQFAKRATVDQLRLAVKAIKLVVT